MENIRVLIVDDDEDFCSLMMEQLGNYCIGVLGTSIEVLTATNSESAIKILETNEIGVIVSDIHMRTPVEGIALLEKAIHINPNIGRLILTGYKNDIHWAMQTSGIWRLTKPCNLTDLIFAIIRLSEPPSIAETDRVLDDVIRKINDTNTDTSSIEKKLNSLFTNGIINKIERSLGTCTSSLSTIEKVMDKYENNRQKMQDLFIVKVDGVCSFYHKFLLALIAAATGMLATLISLYLTK